MASKKVLYKGHPIAGVAANTVHDAEEALALIEVEYELLPAAMTAPEGLADDAPILHEKNRSEYHGDDNDTPTNIEEYIHHVKGDVEEGFAEADFIVERTFDTATVHQGYIEPQNATVHWKKDGRVHIWCSTQGPVEVRDGTANALGIPESQVVLTPQEIGGGFGGKFEPYGAPLAAYLSQKTNRPVKIIMTRTEDLEATGPTPGSHIVIKMGATKEGKLTAAKAMLAYESGAYAGSMIGPGCMCVFAPYELEHGDIEGFGIYVNKPSTNAYRAPGATNAEFAAETVVDELAEKIGIDPLEFRLLNAAKEGTRRVDGPVFPAIGLVEVVDAMKAHPHYDAAAGGPQHGSRRGSRLVDQRRRPVQREHQRPLGRDVQPHRGVAGHRRDPNVHCDAGRRGARHPRRGHPPDGRQHRRGRVHCRNGREPRHLRHGPGGPRRRAGRQAPDD